MKALKVERCQEADKRGSWMVLVQSVNGFVYGNGPKFFYPHNSVEGLDLPINLNGEIVPVRMSSGLQNEELTCFKNSLLQLLAHLPPLVHIAKARFEGRDQANEEDYEDSLYGGILDLVVKDCNRSGHIEHFEKRLSPNLRAEVMSEMPDDKQGCVLEYFDYLFNRLSQEMGHLSIFGRVFGFYTHSEYKCTSCGKYISKSADFRTTLPLKLPPENHNVSHFHQTAQIYSSMAHGPINLSTNNKQKLPKLIVNNFESCEPISAPCSHCPGATFTERTSIVVPPNVLLLAVARGGVNGTVNRTEVEIPSELSLEKLLREGCGYEKLENIYRLYGLIQHVRGARNPHYVAYCRKGNKWYRYDDERVSPVSEFEIEAIYDGCLAAYCRMSPLPLPSSPREFSSIELPPSTRPLRTSASNTLRVAYNGLRSRASSLMASFRNKSSPASPLLKSQDQSRDESSRGDNSSIELFSSM